MFDIYTKLNEKLSHVEANRLFLTQDDIIELVILTAKLALKIAERWIIKG